LYSNLFYYISQVINEILSIIDNINNYYHEIKFDGEIQSYIINIIQNTLPSYDEQLDKKFQKLYIQFQIKLKIVKKIFVGQDGEPLKVGKIIIYIQSIQII
jgi:hypothetical protein